MRLACLRGPCGEGSRDAYTDVGAVDTSSLPEKEDAVRQIEGIEREDDSMERGEPGVLHSERKGESLFQIGTARGADRA